MLKESLVSKHYISLYTLRCTCKLLLIAVGTDPSNDLSEWVGQELSESDRPELTAAKTVVSGGNALQSQHCLHIVITLDCMYVCVCVCVCVCVSGWLAGLALHNEWGNTRKWVSL